MERAPVSRHERPDPNPCNAFLHSHNEKFVRARNVVEYAALIIRVLIPDITDIGLSLPVPPLEVPPGQIIQTLRRVIVKHANILLGHISNALVIGARN